MVKNKFNLRQKVIVVKNSKQKYVGYVVGIQLSRSCEKCGIGQFGGLKVAGGVLKNYLNDIDTITYRVAYETADKYKIDNFQEFELQTYNKENCERLGAVYGK